MEEGKDREINIQSAKKPKIWRYAFLALLAILIFLGFSAYRYNLVLNSPAQYEKDLAARLEAEKQAKMADTYGGSTPAETLQLYIDALKRADYELASKYFIEKNRRPQMEKLESLSKDKLLIYTNNLIQLRDSILAGAGTNTENSLEFITDKPFFSDFELYPNGIWKIIEI